VEVLGVPYTCFNASNYGTLLMVDLEEEYFPEEIHKLRQDVEEKGLSIDLFADWYNVDMMRKIKFFDENSKQWWTPATGGANVPALNDLFAGWRIQFGDRIFDGEITLGENQATFASGMGLATFPRGGLLVGASLADQTEEILRSRTVQDYAHILGLISMRRFNHSNTSGGRIAVFGDSSCLDTAHQRTPCYWLLGKLLQYTNKGLIDENLFGGQSATRLEQADFTSSHLTPPSRLPYVENDLKKFSRVLDSKAVYRVPECKVREYHKYKKEENAVVITWEDINPTGSLTDDRFSLSETIGPDATLIRDNIDGYIVPYFIVVGVVAFLVYATVRGRKDRITAKRDFHNV